jgi:antirestriction protein ArdC
MRAADLFQAVTDQVIAGIEAGAGEWTMPWQTLGSALSPVNAATGRHYTGGNRLALAFVSERLGAPGVWGTYRQWQGIGAQVRKGEHSPIAALRPMDRKRTEVDDQGDEVERHWQTWTADAVFHAGQVDGYQPLELAVFDPIEAAETLTSAWVAAGMRVIHGGDQAYYQPSSDSVHLPERGAFVDVEHYYSTHYHEATHWTGRRLGRDLSGRFGSESYAAEELVAELGAAFLCAETGVDQAPRPDHAAYLSHWLGILRADARHLWTVAAKAEAAASHLTALVGSRELVAS